MRFLSRSREPREPRDRARIERDLDRLGVSAELRALLSRRLEALAPTLSEEAYRAALAGALVAHDLHEQSARHVERNARDYQEIQRLLGVFSAEMKKLDEALRVLSAYVQRMRARAKTPARSESVH
jgi:hypothetical protein